MSDRSAGDAVARAVAAPGRILPGLPAQVARYWFGPVYLVAILAFAFADTPPMLVVHGRVPGQLVWILASVSLVRVAWMAMGTSMAAVERRFWGLLTAAAASLAASGVVYVYEITTSGPAGPPTVSVSTFFDALTIVLLAAVLLSLARFGHSSRAARMRFIVDTVAACVVAVGVLDDLFVGRAFSSVGDGGLPGIVYSSYPVAGALLLLGTLLLVVGVRSDRWESWEKRIAGSAVAFAIALMLTPLGYSPVMDGITGGWSATVVDVVLMSSLLFGISAVVLRLSDHARPWRLRPVSALEPSYGWVASVFLPSIELMAIPVFGIAAFQTPDQGERVFRLAIVAIVSVLLALRTLLAVADSEALLERADTDPLTGLLNHRQFHDRLTAEVDRASKRGDHVGLIAVDVDDFGEVNSVGGHQAGDAALVGLARTMQASVRGQDVVCRVGGDELMVVLPGADLSVASVIAERVVEAVRSLESPTERALGVSAGVTAYPEHAGDKERLVEAADSALYWAKRHGKDRAVTFDPDLVTPVSAEQRVKELRDQANLDSVRALAAAVDARDPGTQDHSRSVSALASALAREMGMEEAAVTLVGYAGLLHDVGKIGVPDAVLRKRGALSDDERERMRAHAPLGAQIVAATAMSDILPWIRHHHERWDGTGHPDGLAGEEIPLGARIVALAEAYDSMVSGRVDRHPVTPRAALQEIDLGLGGKFDPVAGERFVMLMTARSAAAVDGKGR